MTKQQPMTEADRAYRTAVARLNRAGMSRARLAGKLATAGYSDASVVEALDRLERAGLLSDARYAAALAEEFAAAGDGVELIRRKLAQREVPEAVTERALAGHTTAHDPRAVAVDLAKRRLKAMSHLPPPARARRLLGLLARKGYDDELARDVIEQLVPEAGEQDE